MCRYFSYTTLQDARSVHAVRRSSLDLLHVSMMRLQRLWKAATVSEILSMRRNSFVPNFASKRARPCAFRCFFASFIVCWLFGLSVCWLLFCCMLWIDNNGFPSTRNNCLRMMLFASGTKPVCVRRKSNGEDVTTKRRTVRKNSAWDSLNGKRRQR